MYRLLLLFLVLVAAACSGPANPVTTLPTTSAAPIATATSQAPPTTLVEESTTTTVISEPPSTTLPATTTTLLDGEPAIRIDELVFVGEPYLVIANKGTGVGSTGGYWICQFPSYYELPSVDLQPGERLAIPLGGGEVPELVGIVATVDVVEPLGSISDRDGEIGLYTSNEFNSADAIVDYVEWGFPGHARSDVAVAAQIWTTNGYVAVPAEVLAIVAQAFPTAGPQDWFAEIGG